MCAEGHRPICQDTGIVVAFVKVGMDVRWDGATMSIADMVNEGVRRAYTDPDNTLRASIVADPAGARKNTKDNTPAVVHFELVPGDTVDVKIAAKGGGSENKSKFVMLNPSDSIVDWVLKTVPTMGAGWCPPGMLGIGIGGTAEKAMLMAKEALMEPIDMHELMRRGPKNAHRGAARSSSTTRSTRSASARRAWAACRRCSTSRSSTTRRTRRAKPVGMIPNCAATRHAHFTLDGSGAAKLEPPDLARWPKRAVDAVADARARRPRHADAGRGRDLEAGRDAAAVNGRMLTGRDAAHKRIADLLAKGEALPRVDFTNRVIYYVGPVDPVRDEVVGPAGPTTADAHGQVHRDDAGEDRADRDDRQGRARPGGDRGDPQAPAAYLMAVGGAAYLVSKAIKQLARRRVRRPRHGSDLRVRRARTCR